MASLNFFELLGEDTGADPLLDDALEDENAEVQEEGIVEGLTGAGDELVAKAAEIRATSRGAPPSSAASPSPSTHKARPPKDASSKPNRYSREEILSFFRMEHTPTPDFTWVDKITSKQPFFPVAFQPEDPEDHHMRVRSFGNQNAGNQREMTRGRGRGRGQVDAASGAGAPSQSPSRRMQKTEFGWGPDEQDKKDDAKKPEAPWKKKAEPVIDFEKNKEKLLAEIEAERLRLREDREKEQRAEEERKARIREEAMSKIEAEKKAKLASEGPKEELKPIASTTIPANVIAAFSSPAPPVAAASTPATTPATPAAAQVDDGKVWFYLDPKGVERGPFTAVEMDKWMRHDYFKIDLQVKRKSDAQFLPLCALFFRLGANPFTGVPVQTWFQNTANPTDFQKALYQYLTQQTQLQYMQQQQKAQQAMHLTVDQLMRSAPQTTPATSLPTSAQNSSGPVFGPAKAATPQPNVMPNTPSSAAAQSLMAFLQSSQAQLMQYAAALQQPQGYTPQQLAQAQAHAQLLAQQQQAAQHQLTLLLQQQQQMAQQQQQQQQQPQQAQAPSQSQAPAQAPAQAQSQPQSAPGQPAPTPAQPSSQPAQPPLKKVTGVYTLDSASGAPAQTAQAQQQLNQLERQRQILQQEQQRQQEALRRQQEEEKAKAKSKSKAAPQSAPTTSAKTWGTTAKDTTPISLTEILRQEAVSRAETKTSSPSALVKAATEPSKTSAYQSLWELEFSTPPGSPKESDTSAAPAKPTQPIGTPKLASAAPGGPVAKPAAARVKEEDLPKPRIINNAAAAAASNPTPARAPEPPKWSMPSSSSATINLLAIQQEEARLAQERQKQQQKQFEEERRKMEEQARLKSQPVWGGGPKVDKKLSLAEIQAEEARLAAARAAEQERLYSAQLQAQQSRLGTWGAIVTGKPLSFLEIQQQEQLRQAQAQAQAQKAASAPQHTSGPAWGAKQPSLLDIQKEEERAKKEAQQRKERSIAQNATVAAALSMPQDNDDDDDDEGFWDYGETKAKNSANSNADKSKKPAQQQQPKKEEPKKANTKAKDSPKEAAKPKDPTPAQAAAAAAKGKEQKQAAAPQPKAQQPPQQASKKKKRGQALDPSLMGFSLDLSGRNVVSSNTDPSRIKDED